MKLMMLIPVGPIHESHIRVIPSLGHSSLIFFKVLLDFLFIRVQIGAIYFSTSRDRDLLTYKKSTSNT
jgi:hypothetical protein